MSNTIIDFNNLDQYDEHTLIAYLQHQDDLYENEGNAEISDEIYDIIRRFCELSFSGNVYFTGVGSDVRGGKVRLPFDMAGLPQVYENQIPAIVSKSKTAYELYVLSDKLDGTSAQVIYDASGALQIAFSRGNGTEGADITRHIREIKSVPKQLAVAPGKTLAVRLETIITKQNWPHVEKFRSRSGKPYVNARNATAGMMNSSTNDPDVYQYLECVAYTIIGSTESKLDQLNYLKEAGFQTARYITVLGNGLNDAFLTAHLHSTRASSQYDLDGVVVTLNNRDHNTNGQPSHFKYKVADESNLAIATVIDIPFGISKDGYGKPVIHITPTNLAQVTISKCTGFNAKFIKDNRIQPGCKIKITRSGDVIPFCLGVAEEGPLTDSAYDQWFNSYLTKTIGQWKWSKNNVDVIIGDLTSNPDVCIKLMVDIFTKLKIAHLKQGNVEKLYNLGYKTCIDVLNMDYTDLYTALGENGAKVYESFEERLDEIYWPEFMGSLNAFGRGIGRRKLSSLYNALKGDYTKFVDVDVICQVEGFERTTAEQIADYYDSAMDMLSKITTDNLRLKSYDPNVAIVGTKMLGHVVVFTGVRDADLEKEIVEQGGTIGSGVSKKTTIVCAKDPNSNSTKLKKVRQYNAEFELQGVPAILIVDLRELSKMML